MAVRGSRVCYLDNGEALVCLSWKRDTLVCCLDKREARPFRRQSKAIYVSAHFEPLLCNKYYAANFVQETWICKKLSTRHTFGPCLAPNIATKNIDVTEQLCSPFAHHSHYYLLKPEAAVAILLLEGNCSLFCMLAWEGTVKKPKWLTSAQNRHFSYRVTLHRYVY